MTTRPGSGIIIPMLYQFTTDDMVLNACFSDGMDSIGDLADAIELACNFDATITLRDEPGFVRGWVHPDGSWQL